MIYFSEVTNERYYIDTFGLKKNGKLRATLTTVLKK